MSRQLDPTSRQAIDAAVAELTQEFAGIHSTQTIQHCVEESVDQFADADVVDFIPLLVHRLAQERLRAVTRPEGEAVTPPERNPTTRMRR
jgi:hypothetical protein